MGQIWPAGQGLRTATIGSCVLHVNDSFTRKRRPRKSHDYLHFADSLGPITFCAVIYRTTARRLEVVALVTSRQLIGEQTAGGGRKVSSEPPTLSCLSEMAGKLHTAVRIIAKRVVDRTLNMTNGQEESDVCYCRNAAGR